MALWHAAALFAGAALAERVTAAARGKVYEQPWFYAGMRKPGQVISDVDIILGGKKTER